MTSTPQLLPLLRSAERAVGTLINLTGCIPDEMPCGQVEVLFAAAPEDGALLVRRGSEVGILTRARFLALMAGPYGFGRALYGNRPVAVHTRWDPLVVDADAGVEDTASAALRRTAADRYDDLVVRYSDGAVGLLPVTTLFEALSSRLAAKALLDGLTGLANRELLLEEIKVRCAEARSGTRIALMFIDLDRFKLVNDQRGHNAGDLVLQEVGRRLRAAARPGDLVARLGGDEFAVVLDLPAGPGDDLRATAARLAERVVSALAAPLQLAGDQHAPVGASVGVAIGDAVGSDADTLLREADYAMYEAKRAGGGPARVVTSMGRGLQRGRAEHDRVSLQRALDDGEFVLHYQPIVELATGRTRSVEALVRWQHPTDGLRSPADFLPAAAELEMNIAVDRWVLGEACRQLAEWDRLPAVHSPASMNVNVCVQHLTHPRLVDHVVQALAASGIDPERLRIELPEAATVEDLQTSWASLQQLRQLGVALTLDDLGAGSSTLRHLSELALDGVKIDQSFVQKITNSDRDQAVVRLLIDLAHNVGVAVTAEGIETEEQARLLLQLGCTYGQGFHLARPASAAVTTERLSCVEVRP